jgi:hypothetical protein
MKGPCTTIQRNGTKTNKIKSTHKHLTNLSLVQEHYGVCTTQNWIKKWI